MGNIKQKKKICIQCKEEVYLFARKMCKSCAYITKDKIPKEDKHKVKKKPLFSLDEDIIDKEPKESQYDMFLEIYNEREHISEISGKNLVDPEHKMFTWQFEHILPKGTYPDLKFDKKNIMLMTWQEHFDLTNNTSKTKEDSTYDTYFEIKQKAKEDYYNERNNKN